MRFSARCPFIREDEQMLFGLPDTVWFPENGFTYLEDDALSFLLFPVDRPEFFDAVVTDDGRIGHGNSGEATRPATRWVWGAFKMPASIFAELHRLWCDRGSLTNIWERS